MNDLTMPNTSLAMLAKDLTDAMLLTLATRFDAGPMPIVNGKLYDPDSPDAELFHVSIEWRGKGWAICDMFRFVLNKRGEWEYESLPSSRTDADYKRTRYATHMDAFAAYFTWRDKVLKKYQKEQRDEKPKTSERSAAKGTHAGKQPRKARNKK